MEDPNRGVPERGHREDNEEENCCGDDAAADGIAGSWTGRHGLDVGHHTLYGKSSEMVTRPQSAIGTWDTSAELRRQGRPSPSTPNVSMGRLDWLIARARRERRHDFQSVRRADLEPQDASARRVLDVFWLQLHGIQNDRNRSRSRVARRRLRLPSLNLLWRRIRPRP